MNRSTALALAALGAAFAFVATRARAYAPETPVSQDPGEFMGPIYDDAMTYNIYDDDSMLAEPRVAAFLKMIRSLEHSPAAVARDTDWTTFYGGARFADTSNHPVLTGELQGVKLPAAMCRAAGFADGDCVSTAAGAFQFIVPTWNDVRGIAPRLPDFSPYSQQKAAVRLLRKLGVLPAILSNDIDTALLRASPRWASLPYSSAQQNPKSVETALSRYSGYLEA